MSGDNLKRREAFIRDIVDVCIKHQVMIEPDGADLEDMDASEVHFAEFNQKVPLNFYVDLGDLESAIRESVWPVVYGS